MSYRTTSGVWQFHRRANTTITSGLLWKQLLLNDGTSVLYSVLQKPAVGSLFNKQHLLQQRQQQTRTIFTYIKEFLGLAKKDDTNYIIEFLQQHHHPSIIISSVQPTSTVDYATLETSPSSSSSIVSSTQPSSAIETTTTTTTTEAAEKSLEKPQFYLPKLALMRPHHFVEALEYVKQQQLQLLVQYQQHKQQSTVTATENLQNLLYRINTIQEQFFTLRQVGSVLYTITSRNKYDREDWYDAIKVLTTTDHTSVSNTSLTTFPIRSISYDPSITTITTTAPSPASKGSQEQDPTMNKADTTTDTSTTASTIATTTVDSTELQQQQWYRLHVELEMTVRDVQKQLKSSSVLTDNYSSDKINPNADNVYNMLYAARYLLTNFENETGVKLGPKPIDIPVATENKRILKYRAVKDMMASVANDIHDLKATMVTLPMMNTMYNYLGLRNEQAKLLGYFNVAHHVIDGDIYRIKSSVQDSNQIRKLHNDVIQRISPTLRKMARLGKIRIAKRSPIESLLGGKSSSGTGSMDSSSDMKAAEQYRNDQRNMIKLAEEKRVTFAGLVKFTLQIIHDLFGIKMILHDEETDKAITAKSDDVWDPAVKLYHCYDTLNNNEYIGSIYIDPYEREFKMHKPCTVPIRLRSSNDTNGNLPPLICVSVSYVEQLLSNGLSYVTWKHCEDFLHEMGHAIQFVMSKSKYGCILGTQNIPADISELLPKFMELFMTQRSSLYALMDFSDTKVPTAEEEIDATYRVLATDKMLKLAQVTFYGSLELELFSNFQVKGSESIMSLQERIANKIIPHIGLDKNDMAAVIDILEDNVRGMHVACYRYLWCEVHAAMIFDHMLRKMKTDPESLLELRLHMRQYLMEPGANINFDEFKSKIGLGDITLDPLWSLYGISGGNEETSKGKD